MKINGFQDFFFCFFPNGNSRFGIKKKKKRLENVREVSYCSGSGLLLKSLSSLFRTIVHVSPEGENTDARFFRKINIYFFLHRRHMKHYTETQRASVEPHKPDYTVILFNWRSYELISYTMNVCPYGVSLFLQTTHMFKLVFCGYIQTSLQDRSYHVHRTCLWPDFRVRSSFCKSDTTR